MYQYMSDPSWMTSGDSPEFMQALRAELIEFPVKLPKMFQFDQQHEQYVSRNKLEELYKILYSFIDTPPQDLVSHPVYLPKLHDYSQYNREIVTVATLRELYREIYKFDEITRRPSTPITAPPAAVAAAPPVAPPGPSTVPSMVTGMAGPR